MSTSYKLDPKQVNIALEGSSPSVPFRVAANPFTLSGRPRGAIIKDGFLHAGDMSLLPLLICHGDNSVSIVDNTDIATLARARFAFSGSALLILDGEPLHTIDSVLDLRAGESIQRIGFGLSPDGHILVVEGFYTVLGLRDTLHTIGAYAAIMGAYGQVFLDYPEGGTSHVSTIPTTILEAQAIQVTEEPVIAFDAGHGGRDPGALGNGLQEKSLNLNLTLKVIKLLSARYHGTFVTTRKDDTAIELDDRAPLAMRLNPTAFISFHVNAFANPNANGFETFVQPGASARSTALQRSVHDSVMAYLRDFSIVDRGKKQKNLAVLRGTEGKGENKCMSLLFETLFITNAREAKFLADAVWFDRYADVVAEALAKGLGLRKKSVTVAPTAKLFRVQVGAFQSRPNAEALQKRIQDAGFNAIIVQDT